MDGELQMMESFDSNSMSRLSSQYDQGHQSSRKAANLDTSGLSLAEDNTIDNITDDGSILAWFSRQRKERARKAREEGTLDSDPMPMHAQELDPATGVQQQQPRPRPRQQSYKPPVQQQPQPQQQTPKRRMFFPTTDRSRAHPPPSPAKQQYMHANNIEGDESVEPSKMCIPGFIFVNSGQSLSVQTRSGSTSKTQNGDGSSSGRRKKHCLSTKTIILLLVLAVVLAGIMLAIVFTNTSSRRSSSNSSANGSNPTAAIPSVAPVLAPTLSPTAALVETTSQPGPSDTSTASPTIAASPAPSVTPTTMRPTTPGVRSRLAALAPISINAWDDADSPQSLAASWLASDEEAETYNDQQLLQRYVLATLYYSTNGENWSQSSISWNVEWTEECTWWGIECNSNGGVRILSLEEDNLTGVLPPEISLLSDLEEVYLNSNSIGGTIPTEVGLLSSLRRLQLTGNSLTGNLPSALGNLSQMRLVSVKNNNLVGTLPSALAGLSFLRKCAGIG